MLLVCADLFYLCNLHIISYATLKERECSSSPIAEFIGGSGNLFDLGYVTESVSTTVHRDTWAVM